MSHFSRLFCTTALTVALSPGVATADVTADDVWQNMQDYMATLGGSYTVSATRDGNTLSVSETTLVYELPFELGQMTIDFPGLDMSENGDGTVAVAYVDPITYGVAVKIRGEGSFSAKIDLTMDGYSTIASGTRGDVTYTWSANRANFCVRDVETALE